MSRSPAARQRGEPWPALRPLGGLYLVLARAYHRLYDRGWRRPRTAGLPVISVGNITAGGTGKTPAVAWLTDRLAAEGRRVAIVSRGYRGRRRTDPLVVARGHQLLADAIEAGDEAIELASQARAHVVVVGRSRVEAARRARREGADVAVLDDGFQHRRLQREIDLVLVDAVDPLGGGRGLPAGWLREPPAALGRADLILLTRAPVELDLDRLLSADELPAPLVSVLSRLPTAERPAVVGCRHEPSELIGPDGLSCALEHLRDRPVIAVSAIAHPERFRDTLQRLGAVVVERLTWPDHHRFDVLDAQRIRRLANRYDAALLITTAKDAVRWSPAAPRPHVLRVRMESRAEALVLERVRGAIDNWRESQR
ncbi:MAG: tetraacyldisaccharide 4'-kinase [Acidobacteriota bacterium]|nr:MAG: tetraacyldisaccharide 4'-kinase [Acidobacteriota bacterium]